MKKNFFLLLLLLMSGCAGLNLGQPERWVEKNILFSTKLPSLEVTVAPSLSFKKEENTGGITDSSKSTTGKVTGINIEWFYFVDTSNTKKLNFKFETLTTNTNWYMILPDYSQDPKTLISDSESFAGISFVTGISSDKYSGTPVLVKSFGAVVGETTRYQLFYMEKVSDDWLKKNKNILSASDRDFLVAFNKRANESFSITPYSGILSPAKRVEQKAQSATYSVPPANNTSKELPENIKKDIKQKCAAEFPSDYSKQAECVKKQEVAWMELNR